MEVPDLLSQTRSTTGFVRDSQSESQSVNLRSRRVFFLVSRGKRDSSMFHPALNWSARSLVAVLFGLLWIGSAASDLQAQHKEAEHPPAAKAEKDAGHPVAAPAGHPAPAATEASHDPHAKPPGPIDWHTDLALWTLIVFVIFVTVLKIFAWGPLSGALNAREHKIKSDIHLAEEARVKSEKMLVEYQAKLAAAQEEVLKTLAEARRDAEHARQEIMAQTEKDVAATKERAIQEIERTKDAALEELFNHMAGAVANATEHVLGRALTDADQDRLIGDALSEFSRGQAS